MKGIQAQLALLYICAFSLFASAHAQVRAERFDERFGFVVVEDCSAEEKFDAALAEVKDARGLLVDLRARGKADSLLLPLLGKLTDEKLVGDWLEIVPREEWQYVRAIVLWVTQEQSEMQLFELFVTQRDDAEMIVTDSEKKAKRKLKELVRKVESEQRDRMDRMFR